MTERSDLSVDWNVSPRIIWVNWVDEATRELTLQDLADTLRGVLEYDFGALDDPYLHDSEGKAELGGGQEVAITLTLLNAVVAFKANTSIDTSGTVTTANVNGTDLYDSGASFTTTVEPGAFVKNKTDGSIASVLRIVSDDHLIHIPLVGGTDNEWDINDEYDITNVVQVSVTGGNLVALDDASQEISPILPTLNTQLSKTSSASATVQNLTALQHASFGDMVTVDVTSSYSGTEYPNGTGLQPINNMADAIAIATTRGFRAFRIKGDITLTSSDFSEGYIFVGESPIISTIIIEPAAQVQNCQFTNAKIQGTLDGSNTIIECTVDDLIYVNGTIDRSCLVGDITLGGGAIALISHSHTIDMDNPVVIDMGGSGQSLSMPEYSGVVKVTNLNDSSQNIGIGLNAGHVELDSTVEDANSIVIAGVGTIEDNTTGNASSVVNTDGLISNDSINRFFQEILGLLHKNTYIDNTVYDTHNPPRLLSCRVRSFDSKSNADAATDGGSETTGLVGTYTVESSYTGEEMDYYRMTKI